MMTIGVRQNQKVENDPLVIDGSESEFYGFVCRCFHFFLFWSLLSFFWSLEKLLRGL